MALKFRVTPAHIGYLHHVPLAIVCLLGASFICGKAAAAQKSMVKTGAASETALPESPPTARDMPTGRPIRQVEVVVVWGFRLRLTEYDLRRISVINGYRELSDKAVCVTSVCGFVVAPDGAKWRATNVVAASEGELQEMQRNMELEGTTLVIVHPTGGRRKTPEF